MGWAEWGLHRSYAHVPEPQIHADTSAAGVARGEMLFNSLFVSVGCAACHGDHGPYRAQLRGAPDEPDSDVASWILHPQATKPGSPMPSFQRTLDRTQAERLAKYVRELARKQKG